VIQAAQAEGTEVEELSPFQQAMLNFRSFLLEHEGCCWMLFEGPNSWDE
jgi:hypothetical protein